MPFCASKTDSAVRVPFRASKTDSAVRVPFCEGKTDSAVRVPFCASKTDSAVWVPFSASKTDKSPQFLHYFLLTVPKRFLGRSSFIVRRRLYMRCLFCHYLIFISSCLVTASFPWYFTDFHFEILAVLNQEIGVRILTISKICQICPRLPI